MNRAHLAAVLWLHWRMSINRMRRGGTLNAVVQAIVAALSVTIASVTFAVGIVVGALVLTKASPPILMLVWDGVTVAFLFVTIGEVLAELQRSEPLSTDKFLHLPVSLSAIFLINYLSSLFTMAVTIFLPLQTGLILGLALGRRPEALLMAPVAACFFLLVTALVHQFRGWLASLMQNKRRRRNIIALITFIFVLGAQGPNLWMWTNRSRSRVEKPNPNVDRQRVTNIATAVNTYVPFGWPAYAMRATMERRVMPVLLATFGLLSLSALSLRRSYVTTKRIYTGEFTAGKLAPLTKKERVVPTEGAARFLERSIPRLSEQASAIATASFRSLWRAPEAKMMLLSPLIFTVVFGSVVFRRLVEPPGFLRPLMAMGGMAFVLLGLLQLAGNQFGFDRSGFRVFVLASAPRKDILLGKNLALLPFALTMGLFPLVVVELAYPMRVDHLLAVPLQAVSMFLIFCVLCNFLSILVPLRVPAGSLKPAKPNGLAVLFHFLFLPLFAASLGLTAAPLAIEYILARNFPLELALMPVELGLVTVIYIAVLGFQGDLLQKREQDILNIVAAPE
jgi:hypothetical protein